MYIALEPGPFCSSLRYKREKIIFIKKKKELRFVIADPAHDIIEIDVTTFLNSWLSSTDGKGIGLFMQPETDFYSSSGPENKSAGFLFLLRYLFPYKKFLFQLIVGMVAASLISLVLPFLTQLLIDVGIASKSLSIIYLIFGSQLFLFVGSIAIDLIRSWLLLHMNSRISLNIISDFLIKLLKLPIKFFDSKAVGDLSQRIQDHHRIESFLTGTFLSTIFSLINMIVFLIVLAFYNFYILLVFLLMSGMGVLWVFLFQKRRKNLDYKRFARNRENQDKIFEMITGMQEIKLYGAETSVRWKWERLQVRFFKLNIQTLSLEQYQQSGFLFLTHLKNIIISFLAIYQVVNNHLTLGALLSISYIIGQTNSPIEQLVAFIKSAQDARLSMDRLTEIHNKPEEETADLLNAVDELIVSDISLKNVSFQYEGPYSPHVLKNIDMVIPKGKITAIVGSSGSGKTTLMKLLLNFYQPTTGSILLGDYDISEVSPGLWRQLCGTVMQEGYIFFDTIANNIALDGEEIDQEKLKNAVHIANLTDYINDLPLGFNTKIGSSGVGISGGQRQRILIARAVYKNPEYLFFDEATSSLDANNERTIIDNLNIFFRDRTVVIIAHRLSTVKNADQIIVLEDGNIVEQGNHITLCELQGRYFELVKNQLDLE